MSRSRPAVKSWANAYVNEQRQPHGVQGGGRWTSGVIGPAAQGRQGRGKKPPAPVTDAPAGTEARMAASQGDGGEDAGDRAQAQALLRQAAELETQIGQMKAELKAVTRQYQALTGPNNTPPAKPGAAPGAAAGQQQSNTAAAAAAARTYQQQVSRLTSQSAQLQSQISKLTRQRARLLTRASSLMRDAQKGASPRSRSRVAVLTSTADKATATTGSGTKYFSFPIEKSEDTATINPVDGTPDIEIWGKATDGTLDADLQVVDPDASLAWIRKWYDTKANIRLGHDPKRPVGRGIEIDGHYVKALIADPTAKHFIRTGVLNDFSVGIANPDVRVGDPRFSHLDPQGKAVNGVITDRPDGLTGLAEISVVDRGANYGASFQLAKAAADGTPEWTGKLTAPDDLLEKAAAAVTVKDAKPVGKGVTVTLPKNMSLSVKPSDLAKLATFKQQLVTKQAAAPVTKAAGADLDKDRLEDSEREGMPASDFAYVDPQGGRHLPVHDEGHVRSALGRFAQQQFHNPAARKRAARKIVSRAKGMGLDLSDHGTVVEAAGRKQAVPDAAKAAAADAKREEAKARKAVRAALAPVAEPDAAKKKGKLRAVCPGCGAKQNPAHVHCPECGGKLPPGAMTVAKNHDFVCLGCGKNLDKGERHCPQCGKENPGYLPEADRKIPANADADKSGKARVAKGKGKKGKRPTPGDGVAGRGDEKPAGGGREPDGAEVEAFERDAGMSDGDSEKPTRLEAGTLREAPGRAAKAAKVKVKGDGKKAKVKPKKGKKLPPWLKPEDDDGDGAAQKAAMQDGFSDPEVQAALRLKTLGVPLRLGITHDLVCPAYHPAEVRLCYPQATLKTLDLAEWQARADDGTSVPLAEAQKGLDLWNAALTLRNADPADLDDIREGLHKGFRSANLDAKPGPGTFPTPARISAQEFRRPYISEGHAAASPGHDAPNSAKIPPAGGIQPGDFRRGYISAGHADESPSNTHPPAPMPAPDRTGEATQGPARTYYRNSARDAASHAMAVLHDHIAIHHPGLCPMTGSLAERPVPTPEGVPPTHPAPGSRGLGKSARAAAKKEARRAERKAVRAGKRKAAKIRKKARDRRRGLESKVLKGKLTVEEARAKLGLEPVVKAAAVTAPPAPEPLSPAVTQIEPDALKSAVKAATRPLIKQIRQQGRTIRKVRKTADAIARQPDTSGAPFRGVALAKSAAPSPAGALSIAQPVEQAQASRYADLYDIYRNSPDPAERRTAFDALRPFWDPSLAKH